MSYFHERWRWDVGKHLTPTMKTISVLEPTAEQIEERKKKIEAGAKVIPFGFARAMEVTNGE